MDLLQPIQLPVLITTSLSAPIHKVEGWDGHILWLKITEQEVVRKYERDEIVPDSSRYYVKDYPVYNTAYYPPFTMIPAMYTRNAYTTTTTPPSPKEDILIVFKCKLCREPNLKTEDALSDHIRSRH